jgi:uncharacterized protein YjiS (DUF1127 family)
MPDTCPAKGGACPKAEETGRALLKESIMSSTLIHETASCPVCTFSHGSSPSLLRRLLAMIAHEIRIHRDMRILSSLGDAALQDIGLTRGSVEGAVRHGRAEYQRNLDLKQILSSAQPIAPQPTTDWR